MNDISRSSDILFYILFADFSFIYPYLIYCIEVWGYSHVTHLNQ